MPSPLRCTSLIPSSSVCAKQCYRPPQSRSFSSSPSHDQRLTRNRRALFRWLTKIGIHFENPAIGSTNYLGAYRKDGTLKRSTRTSKTSAEPGDGQPQTAAPIPETIADRRPFPLNVEFRSQTVLSEALREVIWGAIMQEGKSVRDVSARYGVEMRRVGAVVRLMEIEKEWKRIGKPLARPYARAVMEMLPKTEPESDIVKFKAHESINDLPMHAATGQQIFHPTSESRVFTRADAAKIFDENLLPADDRVPHPELALMQKDFLAGMSKEEVEAEQAKRDEIAENRKQWHRKKEAKKLAEMKIVDKPRWEFRITPVNGDDAGRDGRGHNGVGWRYGAPLMDRRRGQHKIPRTAGF